MNGYHHSIISAGGRRFLLVVGFGIVYTVLLWFSKLDGNQYVTLQSLTIGAYLTVNTIQKIKGTPE